MNENAKCISSNLDRKLDFSGNLSDDTQYKFHSGNLQYIADHPNFSSGINWTLYIWQSTKIGDKSVFVRKCKSNMAASIRDVTDEARGARF
jgi:hypothetical protein